jgi:hypothetical protein
VQARLAAAQAQRRTHARAETRQQRVAGGSAAGGGRDAVRHGVTGKRGRTRRGKAVRLQLPARAQTPAGADASRLRG